MSSPTTFSRSSLIVFCGSGSFEKTGKKTPPSSLGDRFKAVTLLLVLTLRGLPLPERYFLITYSISASAVSVFEINLTINTGDYNKLELATIIIIIVIDSFTEHLHATTTCSK